MKRCRLKTFSILGSGGHFLQRSKTILSLLVKGHQRYIFVKLFEIGPLTLKQMAFRFFSAFSSGGHFVQRSGTILQYWKRVTQETFL